MSVNYIRHINEVWDRMEANQDLRHTSRLVYLALAQINNESRWKERFTAVYGQVLSMTGIANVKTYYACLRELVDGGYIVYEKGPNQYQAATFTLCLLFQKTDKQTERQGQSTVNASGKQTDQQGKSNGNIPKPIKPLKLKTEEIEYMYTYRKFDHLELSFEELDKLIEFGYTKNQVDSILDQIQNYKFNKKYKSLFLTSKMWLEKEKSSAQKEKGDGGNRGPKASMEWIDTRYNEQLL